MRYRWNAGGRTRATEEASSRDGNQCTAMPPSTFPLFFLSTHILSCFRWQAQTFVIPYYTFLVSISCYLHILSCLWHGDLLTIYLTLWFAWGRHVLYTLLYTDSSRYNMYKTCALWWGGAGPRWIQIPEPHSPLLLLCNCIVTSSVPLLHFYCIDSENSNPLHLCLWAHVLTCDKCFPFSVSCILQVAHMRISFIALFSHAHFPVPTHP